MNSLWSFVIGFMASFLGLLAPSMLNMTAARMSMEKGRSAGIQFAAGAACVVFVQGYIAVFFAQYLVANPEIIVKLKTISIFVLLGLAIFFFRQARGKIKIENKRRKGANFMIGMGLSSLNMLAIPFYLAIATFAESKGWMKIKSPFKFVYILGTALGSFLLFSMYAYLAAGIAKNVQFIASNLNYILSILFLILAVIVTVQILS